MILGRDVDPTVATPSVATVLTQQLEKTFLSAAVGTAATTLASLICLSICRPAGTWLTGCRFACVNPAEVACVTAVTVAEETTVVTDFFRFFFSFGGAV